MGGPELLFMSGIRYQVSGIGFKWIDPAVWPGHLLVYSSTSILLDWS